MASPQENPPVRSFMDNPNIKWRYQAPDFSIVDKKYMKERSRNHAAGSLEKVVENLVKTWEMESTHKIDLDVSDNCSLILYMLMLILLGEGE